MRTAAEILAASKETDSVANLIQIVDYRPDLQTFCRADGGIVILAQVGTFPAYDQPDAMLESYAEAIASGISSLDEGTIFSATYYITKRVNWAVDAFYKAGGEDIQILKNLEEARVEVIEGGTRRPLIPFSGARGPFRTKVLNCLMSITVFPNETDRWNLIQGLLDSVTPGDPGRKRAEAIRQKVSKKAREAWNSIASRLQQCGCEIDPLDDMGAIAYLRDILYPRTGWQEKIVDEPWLPIHLRVPIGQIKTNADEGVIQVDRCEYRVATLDAHPKLTFPGSISLPTATLQGASILEFLDNGFVTINAMVEDKETTRAPLHQTALNIEGGMGMPGRKEQASEDVYRALTWLETHGRKVCRTEMIAAVWGETGIEAEDRLRQLTRNLTEVTAKWKIEQRAAPTFFFRALPGNAYPPISGACRDIPLVDRQIADLLPIYYRSNGTKEAACLWHAPNGEPFTFSLWGGSSQGFIISGRTGTGKSFTGQDVITMHLRRPNSEAIIIDKGRSYLALALSFQSRGIYQDLGQGACTINVLEGAYNKISTFATSYLRMLICRPGTTAISQAQEGILSEALKEVFDKASFNITYVTYEDIQKAHPKAFIARARKRMTANFVEANTIKLLAATSRPDSSVKVLYKYILTAVVKENKNTGDNVRTIITTAQSIPLTDFTPELANLGFEVETVDNDSGFACNLIHQSPDYADIMQSKGFEVALDRTLSYVDLATEEDVRDCETAGIKFECPIDIIEKIAAQRREEILNDPEFAGASHDLVTQVVRRRIKEIKGEDIFGNILGEATVQHEVTLGDLGRRLEDLATQDQMAQDLVDRLKPYYGDGPYHKYFDGQTTIRLGGAKLIVIELAQLLDQTDPHIFNAILAALINHISNYSQKQENRSKRKLVIVEEGWQLIKDVKGAIGVSSIVGDALVNLYRTGRKFGVATGLVTQNVTDLERSSAGQEIISNAPIRIIHRQSETEIDGVARMLKLSEEQKTILSAVKTNEGYYSSFVIMATEHSPPVFEVAMLIPDPVQYWTFTSKPNEVTHREEETEKYQLRKYSDEQARAMAIMDLAKKYPHGLVIK